MSAPISPMDWNTDMNFDTSDMERPILPQSPSTPYDEGLSEHTTTPTYWGDDSSTTMYGDDWGSPAPSTPYDEGFPEPTTTPTYWRGDSSTTVYSNWGSPSPSPNPATHGSDSAVDSEDEWLAQLQEFLSKDAPIRSAQQSAGPKKKITPKKPSPLQLSEDQQSLKDLRDVEYSPRHSWTEDEKHLLRIMYCFYHDAGDKKIAEIFNHMMGLELTVNKIKSMNGSIGGLPDSCCAGSNNHAIIRSIIEVNLRGDSPDSLSGFAIDTSDEDEMEVDVSEENSSEPESPRSDTSWSSASTDEPASPRSDSSGECRQPSNLAFRVWDENSQTIFRDSGFVSAVHGMWNGPLLPPPNLDTIDGWRQYMLLSSTHLSKIGGSSSYISVTTSLIQAMNYAVNMVDPQIAVIDLSHPSLQEKYKKIRAEDALRELKEHGQVQWAKYKGRAEIMIWGDIPMDAIISYGPLEDACHYVESEPSREFLLNWDDFYHKQTVAQLTQRLKARNITLDTDVGRALGLLAKGMGLDREGVTIEHITEFVQVCMDGWTIKFGLGIFNARSPPSIAGAFAMALGQTECGLEDVLQAFRDGWIRAEHSIEYYENRARRPYKARKFRTIVPLEEWEAGDSDGSSWDGDDMLPTNE